MRKGWSESADDKVLGCRADCTHAVKEVNGTAHRDRHGVKFKTGNRLFPGVHGEPPSLSRQSVFHRQNIVISAQDKIHSNIFSAYKAIIWCTMIK
jgi:hypothetical protein